jgi:phosphoribosylformimino-5-aminoimidazole carboxamide ribotide isomerase
MDIFPAIDLQNGQCVRLTQGDFDTAKIYDANPVAQARKFMEEGAEWLHVVDLDGARCGESRQFDLVAKITEEVPLKLQIGGGIRAVATIEKLLECGVERVIIGSLAVKNPPLVQDWLKRFGPARIVLAFDIRFDDKTEPRVLTDGWQSESGQILWDVLDGYADSGLKTILCTDIRRDGMLAGVNVALYDQLARRWPRLSILASGGVRDMADMFELKKGGLAGVIVGKALYEGRINLAAALKEVKDAG